jgi:c-di-AMP phosphodiesterase-like protein
VGEQNHISKLMKTGRGIYFVLLLLFAAASFYIDVRLGVLELIVTLAAGLYFRISAKRKKHELEKYFEELSVNVSTVSNDAITNFPIPVLIAAAGKGTILWCNELFLDIYGGKDTNVIESNLSQIIPGLDTKWLMEGRGVYPGEIRIGEKYYKVFGNLVRSKSISEAVLTTLYFEECTETVLLRQERKDRSPVIAIIAIDNYEELVGGDITESEKSSILTEIDKRLAGWTAEINGYLRRYDRDKYVFFLEEQDFRIIQNRKFTILDDIRSIQSLSGINATLSIGFGVDGKTIKEKASFAILALEMALSRGGDQVVIRNQFNFEFYGGMSKEVEKRTKVKSRVMASALGRLIKDSSMVLVMGHKTSDVDSIGAAAGVACAVRRFEKPVKIVVDKRKSVARSFISRLEDTPEYAGVMISPEDAVLMADRDTLVVVVDTNRPDMVESETLLQAANKVAVIDHHRRAAQYIENCAVNMHEPYASSACELVSELLQYMVPNRFITAAEAECMLAGIYLDTKGFTMKTGVRTFEASAYLRRAGADMTEVKKMFQSSFTGYMERQSIIQEAKSLENGVVIAITDKAVDRAVAGQAADELLNIIGINASIVAVREDGKLVVSARSLGKINVQVLMEALGGGGNITAAGAQITGMTAQELEDKVRQVVEDHFQEIKRKEAEKAEKAEKKEKTSKNG